MLQTKHHPDINLLAEYASGSLDWALSIGIATHVHFCPECREKIQLLNRVGGDLLIGADSAAVDNRLLERLLEMIDDVEGVGREDDRTLATGASTWINSVGAGSLVTQAEQSNSVTLSSNVSNVEKSAVNTKTSLAGADKLLAQVKLPKIIRKLLPEGAPLTWKKVSPALKMARLESGQSKYEVAFHQINAGGKVAEHGHTGLEVTIVLKGSFSDADGIYNEGDFILRQPGDVHRPTAAQDQDCLCISISEAPVKLTGLLGRLVNPFISFRPA